KHELGRRELVEGTVERIYEALPQQRAGKDKNRIWHSEVVDLKDSGLMKDHPNQCRRRRGQKDPQISQERPPILRPEVSDEQSPGQFPRYTQVCHHPANELAQVQELRFGRINYSGSRFNQLSSLPSHL